MLQREGYLRLQKTLWLLIVIPVVYLQIEASWPL
jgi:hypothetical protein